MAHIGHPLANSARWRDVSVLQQIFAHGVSYGRCTRTHAEAAEDIANMAVNRVLAQCKLLCYLLIAQILTISLST